MSLFRPSTVGAFRLKHRVVFNPPLLGWSESQLVSYFDELDIDGGLVLAPKALTTATKLTQELVINRVHGQEGVVFAQVSRNLVDIGHGLLDLISAVKNALSIGYDGVELEFDCSSSIKDNSLVTSSSGSAVSAVIMAIQVISSQVAMDRVGIKLQPYGIAKGGYGDFHSHLIQAIRGQFPSLCFFHIVAHQQFDDFEYPSNKSLYPLTVSMTRRENQDNITFISEDAYDHENANTTAFRTSYLVAFGLLSQANPNLVGMLRDKKVLRLAPSTEKRLEDINNTLQTGKEYIVDWTSQQESRIHQAMQDLDKYLTDLNPSLSYEGTDKKVVWRKSCWLASEGIARPFLDSEKDIAAFDGDYDDGLTGLEALRDARVRESAEYLKSVLDSALVTTSKAVGIEAEMLQRCTVRYRVVKYTPHAGSPGGIGLHPDGNLLSALITNGPGLRVYDLDGTVRQPGHTGTIMMGGSTLYRWSQGRYPPTFHDVDISGSEVKVSIVAFFNFPDKVRIPQSLVLSQNQDKGFFHDIRRIKEDDKLPSGELSALWDVIIERHRLVLPPGIMA
ncbi:hypothetical protein FZEAL_5887 [Fusarium zealandicum]|uniref:Fe2OG dioxygenase domain-containing protein n=1 Tax=Fusarium zealandicum TaxID=1053134 RepID=A0A8H4UJX3_9HYPO|nr:hypothetical protein FZEAL_5887 [Fusarium zealandicum]